jgi:peroxiredoxin family protein
MEVSMFFAFWGLSVIRNPAPSHASKPLWDKLASAMIPRGASRLKLSRMNLGGIGTLVMKRLMRAKGVCSLEELLQQARSLGIDFIACQMSMGVMGLTREELMEGVRVAGVATYLERTSKTQINLFI